MSEELKKCAENNVCLSKNGVFIPCLCPSCKVKKYLVEEITRLKSELNFYRNEFSNRESRAEKLEADVMRLQGDLMEIAEMKWTPVTDGAGPEDCTANEKGLLQYVGRVSAIAEQALQDKP